MDFFIKLMKFIGFLIMLGIFTIAFMMFGWGGLIISILIIGGAISIFFGD